MRRATLFWLVSLLSVAVAPAALARENAPSLLGLGFREPSPQGSEYVLVLAELPRLTLNLPCIGCRMSLRAATHGFAPSPEPVEPVAPPPRPAAVRPTKPRPLAIGDTWPLRNGRAFTVQLTPTPEECAPLVRLSF